MCFFDHIECAIGFRYDKNGGITAIVPNIGMICQFEIFRKKCHGAFISGIYFFTRHIMTAKFYSFLDPFTAFFRTSGSDKYKIDKITKRFGL